MTRPVSIALTLFLLALTAGIPVVVYDLHRDLADVHTVIDEMGGTERAGHRAIDNFNEVAEKEKQNSEDTIKDAKKTGDDTRRLIAHLDRVVTRINEEGGTLDLLDSQIQGNGEKLQAAIGNLGTTFTKLGDTADEVTETTNSLNLRIEDPRVDSLLDSFNLAAKEVSATAHNASLMSGEGVSILGHGDHIIGYYDQKLTTPLGFWKTFLSTGLDFGSKGANIAVPLVKH